MDMEIYKLSLMQMAFTLKIYNINIILIL